ncbi:MAG: hypothetical protein DI565_11720 [Ancylobacter novellus]|uniref:Uncharacterized protein n=1 Tax=Ancylobacter novellus TaxID=921 RepID=A0A2W5KDI1_ANCNO|nr:MAG: hypothetical protein DI565_11720 [Ancylobacter novellus]
MLQLLDVTLGALASIRNERHLDGKTGEVKRELAQYALSKSGLRRLDVSTAIMKKDFNVWNVVPKFGGS